MTSPNAPAEGVVQRLSFLDRTLTLWIFLAMGMPYIDDDRRENSCP